MRLSDGLGQWGRRFSSTLLAELPGLDAFTLLQANAQDIGTANSVIAAHLSYLSELEDKVEDEAKQRAIRYLPPEAALRLAHGTLAKEVYASFRVYRVHFIEAHLPELREQVSTATARTASDSTVMLFARALGVLLDKLAAKTGEDLADSLPDWRLRATVALCALIDLSSYALTLEEEDVLWQDGSYYDRVMSDIVPISA